jgi:hypothetical protein
MVRWAGLAVLLGGLLGVASVNLGFAANLLSPQGFAAKLLYPLVLLALYLLYPLGLLALYGVLRQRALTRLGYAGAMVIAFSVVCTLILTVVVHLEGRSAVHWGQSWWKDLLLYTASLYGTSFGGALLGVSAARERSFGVFLRVLPLIAAALYPASILLNLLMNVAMGTQWESYWPSWLMGYQPFLQSVLLGGALFQRRRVSGGLRAASRHSPVPGGGVGDSTVVA